jgi:hypothetical protein
VKFASLHKNKAQHTNVCPNSEPLNNLHLRVRRYKALSSLQLPWISQKRATSLAQHFVSGKALPNVQELCSVEPFALPKRLLRSSMLVNASVAQLQSAAEALELHNHICGVGHRHEEDQAAASIDHAAAPGGSQAAAPSTSSASAAPQAGVHSSEPANQRTGIAAGATALAEHNPQADHQNSAAVHQAATDGLSAAMALYSSQRYVLLPARPNPAVALGMRASLDVLVKDLVSVQPRFILALKAEATNRDKLQAALQAAAQQQHLAENSVTGTDHAALNAIEVQAIVAALEFAQCNVDGFACALQAGGWNVNDVIMWSGQRNVLEV